MRAAGPRAARCGALHDLHIHYTTKGRFCKRFFQIMFAFRNCAAGKTTKSGILRGERAQNAALAPQTGGAAERAAPCERARRQDARPTQRCAARAKERLSRSLEAEDVTGSRRGRGGRAPARWRAFRCGRRTSGRCAKRRRPRAGAWARPLSGRSAGRAR